MHPFLQASPVTDGGDKGKPLRAASGGWALLRGPRWEWGPSFLSRRVRGEPCLSARFGRQAWGRR